MPDPDDPRWRDGCGRDVDRDPQSLKVAFDVTDFDHNVRVTYEGILPDLFREGQGVVVQGRISGTSF